ncbi:hypothetical protein [Pseudonocardia acaciae]|uniref:hypothetical protein n=1 Tax=Pseudonocardia acaciae TaxID=551276 RepID=UPI00048EFF6C|nr:hypothetical protein [Pseudonocardia acaciae]
MGSAPGADWGSRLRLAGLRALRTFIQGVVAAFPTAGAGELVLSAPYWQTFAFALLAAATTAIASFLQNIANFLPTDPTQAAPN